MFTVIEERDWLMKKEETPILVPIPSFSSCLDQARNILFPNIFLKKEEIGWSEENIHLCLHLLFGLFTFVLNASWKYYVLYIFVDDIKSSFIDNTQTKPVSLGVHTFNHLLYADDLVILSESPTGLQNCLNALDNYCEKWRLNINIKKTKPMILSKTDSNVWS
jgi:hypothetical protein